MSRPLRTISFPEESLSRLRRLRAVVRNERTFPDLENIPKFVTVVKIGEQEGGYLVKYLLDRKRSEYCTFELRSVSSPWKYRFSQAVVYHWVSSAHEALEASPVPSTQVIARQEGPSV